MDRTGAFRSPFLLLLLLLGFVALLMSEAPSAAAEASPALTCSATRLPDGAVSYQLSQPPSSPQCETCWEDHNKTVIARDSEFDANLIQNLTNQSITLKVCRDYLLYIQECSGNHEEVLCRVNCSELLGKDPFHPSTVNSTLTCFFGSWCPDTTTVILGIVGFLIAVIVIGSLFLCRCLSKQMRQPRVQTVSYTPANQNTKLGQMYVV